ncbi:MAG: hypothetical protein MUC77_07860 [Chromatiaceae bacterium]|jgi:hypothetical protein|nr:hypothetical protein [Chromatiaceae bacterium]
MSRRDPPRPRPRRLEEALLEVARRELEAGEPRPEVWETALRLARGDDRRAVSAYLRLRVRALLAAHEARARNGETT